MRRTSLQARAVLLLAGVLAAPCAHAGQGRSPVTLSNGQLIVSITPCIDGVRPGSLVELTDVQTGIDLVDYHQFGGLQCGPFIPENGEIVSLSDTEAVFQSWHLKDYSTGIVLPVRTQIDYRLVGRGLEIGVAVITWWDPVELWSPLEVDFNVSDFDTLYFSNQTCTDRTVIPDQGLDLYRISGDQVVECVRDDGLLDVQFVVPNPTKAILALNDETPTCDNYLSVRIFDVEPPRENCQGPILHSLLPPDSTYGFFIRMEIGDGFCPAYFSMHPDGFERTASWIFDEIPLIHPFMGYMWAFSETSDGDEPISAFLISLLEGHPLMKMNLVILADGIFEDNADSMWFEPGCEDSWSHWHCTWRICTEAPPEYLTWLQNIQNHVYPWSQRVRLGSHGYHHTPNQDSTSGSLHEFITYEPGEHMERFAMIDQDLTDMGLCLDSTRVIRYAGHRTSLSGLWATIAHGFEFYCNGVRWYEQMGGEPFWDMYLSRYETPAGRIWGTNTVWWADYAAAHPTAYVSTVMERGKHALMGGHPVSVWYAGDPAAYARVDSVCTSLEEDYPWFGWLLPIEYGRFLEETYRIDVTGMRTGQDYVELDFTGSTSRGQTVVAEVPETMPVESVTIDGNPVTYVMHSATRLFADCGNLSGGDHVFKVQLQGTGIEGGGGVQQALRLTCSPNPFCGSVTMTGSGFGPGAVVRIYDLGGRLVLEQGFTGVLEWSADDRDVPPGLYIVCVTDGSGASSAPVRLVRL